MDINTYNNNLNAIKIMHPPLYEKLCAVKENTKYEVFVGKNDPLDVNIYDKQKGVSLYNKPVDDTIKIVEEHKKFSNYPFLVFFGFGNGVFFKALLENPILTDLIVIEPEIEILFIALHLVDFTGDIIRRRIVFVLSEDLDYKSSKTLIVKGTMMVFLKTYDLRITLPYYASYQDELSSVNKAFISASVHATKSHGNDAIDSLIGVQHFIKNIPEMVENYPFSQIKGEKNSDLAIIVSTGPSLNKQLPLLKEIADFVTIISVDASLPILEKWGIKPDIVCSIERVEDSALFFEQTSEEFQEDILFVLAALQHERLLKAAKAKRKMIVMRPFGYMHYFDMPEFGYCGIGMSAANMAFEVAFIMGFPRMAFIGQDLSYANDGRSHAAGHVYGENEILLSDADYYIPAYGGEGSVRSTEVWTLFMGYFVSYIADVKSKMEVINATEGGARIEGSIEMPFAEVVEKYVDKNRLKRKIELTNISQERKDELLLSAKEKVQEILNYAHEKKGIVEKLFLEVTELCATIQRQNVENKLEEIDFTKVQHCIEEIDKVKKMFNEKEFYQLFWETVRSFIISSELNLATIAVKYVQTDIERKAKMIEFLFAHKGWLFFLAGGMDAMITVVERSGEVVMEKAKKIKE